MQIRLFLNNIRSAHNVGAIFRTADGAGVEHVYLGGYTPTPIDRFGRRQPQIAKTSLGASETVPWEAVPIGEEVAVLRALQDAGFAVVAVEQAVDSVSLYEFVPPARVVYVLGNEVAGVDSAILDVADTVLEIPLRGVKESLNVATTGGIVLFTHLPPAE
ncbi:MAG TPA: TrmH family RNA methyltransferase [Candidatus Paceibacterota bacterium]|nr:TrmH family RNA methyltransferase [Candidatus Paceibacterota bacterium]